MRIALFGYGKMGKMIEQIAVQRGHVISAKVDIDTETIDYYDFDVAIDFSTPASAFQNITSCFEHGIPVIAGTTGWLDKYEEAVKLCEKKKSAFIYASNFSLGVNIFFELNATLAAMMKNLEQYSVSIEEIHHTQKLDAPSGTAISLARGIIEKTHYDDWVLQQQIPDKIPIRAIRDGEIPGTHTVSYESSVDTISIQHKAHNREGFALGAVIAAEWILGKTGVFSMKDVLNLG